MSVKSDVVAILAAKKDEKLAAVAAEFDALVAAVQALPEDGDLVTLQAQVADLQAKLDAANVEVAKDLGEISADEASITALQDKLAKIKALLDA